MSAKNNLNKVVTHYNRFSSIANPFVNIFDSNTYKVLVEEIETKGISDKNNKMVSRSCFVEQFPSYFPPQMIPTEALHTIGFFFFFCF